MNVVSYMKCLYEHLGHHFKYVSFIKKLLINVRVFVSITEGYLTLWEVGKFLKNPCSEEQDLVKQVMCWRAHLTKVVSLTYVDSLKAILSGSTDGSARYAIKKKL